MGIMNKMKTVDLESLVWTKAFSNGITWVTSSVTDAKKPPSEGTIARIKSEKYPTKSLTQVYSERITGETGIAIRNTNGYIYVNTGSADIRPSGFLTYETIDSVEEEIISYHPQQLVIEMTTSAVNNYRFDIVGNDATVTKLSSSSPTWFTRNMGFKLVNGHKYVVITNFKNVFGSGAYLKLSDGTTNTAGIGENTIIVSNLSDAAGIHYYYLQGLIMQVNDPKTFYIRIVDLTALYGAGNEPTSVETFLSQHPEYNSYVPYYDGEINITEEIM